ncbi:MAG: hypothetical protein ACXWKY_01760 [Caulobacteraceae bacterium]
MWSAIPDLRSTRALVAVAAVACLCAAVLIVLTSLPLYLKGYGDTDDAVRLVLARELLSGRPWYHPEILRLQFPSGGLMHWSRLIDGGIAGLDRLLELVLPPAGAELSARALWPLLWLPFAISAACVAARRLAGSAGLLAAGLLAAISLPALEQFRLGRIDHHNVQIVLCLIATSAAMTASGGRRIAAIAGLASGLGLAIGTEAIVFHAAIAASFALRLLIGDPGAAPKVRAYGLSLAATIASVFLLQTPPSLWGVSVCDTLGVNLVIGMSIGGVGLAAASFAPPGAALAIVTAAAGAASAAAYLLLHPSCLHGPMGDVPAFLRGYIDQMTEMRPFWEAWRRDRLACDGLIAPGLAALTAPVLLARQGRGRKPEWLLLAALLYMALGLGLLHIRLLSYANWFAIPLVAAAVAEAAALWRRFLVPTVLAAALVSPVPATAAILGLAALADRHAPAPAAGDLAQVRPASAAKCSDHAAFDRLRRLPQGLVLTDPDIGAFVLAETPHAVLAGPYHRLVPGLTETFRLFSEPLDQARGDLASRRIAYVVDCPAEANKADHAMIGPGGLLGALDRRAPPVWLEPLSGPDERLQVYAFNR